MNYKSRHLWLNSNKFVQKKKKETVTLVLGEEVKI